MEGLWLKLTLSANCDTQYGLAAGVGTKNLDTSHGTTAAPNAGTV